MALSREKKDHVQSGIRSTLQNIVLDIDDSLATHFEDRFKESPFLTEFRDRGLILEAAQHQHILHPGVIEFIRYLSQLPGISVSFLVLRIKSVI